MWEVPEPGDDDGYVVPDHDGRCITNIVPALLEWETAPDWLPSPAARADQVVVLVLDGLGWDQLQAHRDALPTLCDFDGGFVSTVAPSTTATALTSLATGLTQIGRAHV